MTAQAPGPAQPPAQPTPPPPPIAAYAQGPQPTGYSQAHSPNAYAQAYPPAQQPAAYAYYQGYGQPVAYGQPAAYGQQPVYAGAPAAYPQAPQPGFYGQGYSAPGYYAQGYYAAPVAYPFVQPEPDHTLSTFAGIMWILCLIRDLVMLVVVLAAASILAAFTFGLGGIVGVLAIFPLIGLIGSALAMSCDFGRKNHAMGTVGAVMALIGSSIFGMLVWVGPIGLILSVLGLILHVLAKKEFPAGA